MKHRRDRLARAMAINEKLWRIEQTRLAQAESKLAALCAAEAAAFEAFGKVEPRIVLGLLSGLVNDRLIAEEALAKARSRAQEYGRRLKLTEKLHDKVDDLERQPGQPIVITPPGRDISLR